MLRAFNIISDKDIFDYISNDSNDIDMLNIIRISLNVTDENDNLIKDQSNAITFLVSKLKKYKNYGDLKEDIINKKRDVCDENIKNRNIMSFR